MADVIIGVAVVQRPHAERIDLVGQRIVSAEVLAQAAVGDGVEAVAPAVGELAHEPVQHGMPVRQGQAMVVRPAAVGDIRDDAETRIGRRSRQAGKSVGIRRGACGPIDVQIAQEEIVAVVAGITRRNDVTRAVLPFHLEAPLHVVGQVDSRRNGSVGGRCVKVTGASDACNCARVAPPAKPFWKAAPVAAAMAGAEPAPLVFTVPVRSAGVNTFGELPKIPPAIVPGKRSVNDPTPPRNTVASSGL